MDILPVQAFTVKNETGVSAQLISPIIITNGEKYGQFNAFWDTGATISGITREVALLLELIPSNEIGLCTASGFKRVSMYKVTIQLSNNIIIPDIEVCECESVRSGVEGVIGMDIITKGDFVVNNYDGKTSFSFRIPSTTQTDYTLDSLSNKYE